MHKEKISYVQVACNKNIFKPTWLSVKIFRNQNIYSHNFKLKSKLTIFYGNDLSASDAVFTFVSFREKADRSVVLEQVNAALQEGDIVSGMLYFQFRHLN